MFDYDELKRLSAEIGVPVKDLIVLAAANDPFYAGVPGRLERAEWFANIWQTYGFRHGTHVRRIHYVLISQDGKVRWPDGLPYENTVNHSNDLGRASLAARYLELIPDGVLIDRRNPEPMILAEFEGDPDPGITMDGDQFSVGIPRELSFPELYLSGFRRDQDFVVEVWIEKSTMNDILLPLAKRLGFNLVTGVGEMSETAARLAVDRAVAAGKPMRIAYVSDFDPGGRSMPVAVARKIEYRLCQIGADADIQLQPILLTPEQCVQYRLPRTPIKESERRAGKFEERFGEGATELDALEALHPGKLSEIVSAEVGRYLDPTLGDRVWEAKWEVNRRLEEIEDEVRERHADEIAAVETAFAELRKYAGGLETRAADLWARMGEDLVELAPYVEPDHVPEPRDPDPIPEPLFDSKRSYIEQIGHYKEWQGK